MEYKNPTISTVRGLAIIFVIYGHVIQRTMIPNGADFFLNPAFKLIYTFHMPLFFFISGYLMSLTLNKRTTVEAFLARCKSLLVPFVSWAILGVLTFCFLDQLVGKKFYLNDRLVNSLLINPSIWFLFTLFVLSCLLLISVQLEKKWGLIAFLVIYVETLVIPHNECCALFYIKWFYLFYLGGYFYNRCKVVISTQMVPLKMLAVFMSFLILASYWSKWDYIYINRLNFMLPYGQELLGLFYRYVVGFLGIAAAFYLGHILSKTKSRHLLEIVGVFSLDIYLIQSYIVEGIYPIIVDKMHIRFDFNSPFFMFCFVPAVAVLLLGTCMLISKLLIRRSVFLNRILLGRRI